MGRRRDKLPIPPPPRPQGNEEWSPVRTGGCSLPSGPILPAGSMMGGMPHSPNLGPPPPFIQNLFDDVSQHNFSHVHQHHHLHHDAAAGHGCPHGHVRGTSFPYSIENVNDHDQYRPFEHLSLDPHPPPQAAPTFCNVTDFVRHQIRNYYLAHHPALVHPPPQHAFSFPQLPSAMGQGYVHHHHRRHENVNTLGQYHPLAFSGNLAACSQRPPMGGGGESRRNVAMQQRGSMREPTLEITDDTVLSQILDSMEEANPEPPPFFSRSDVYSPRSHLAHYDQIDWSFEPEAWRNRSTETDIFERPRNPIAATLDSFSSLHPSRDVVTRGSHHGRSTTPSSLRRDVLSRRSWSDAANSVIAPIPIPAELAKPLILPCTSRDASCRNPSSSPAISSSSLPLPPRSSSPFYSRHGDPLRYADTQRHHQVRITTDDRRFVPSGHTCVLCMQDLAHPPQGPVNMFSNPPPVSILPCHHYYHTDCLDEITPPNDAVNPPCVVCSLPE